MQNPEFSYSQAVFFYQNHLFEQALPLFSELTLLYPHEKKYWVGFSFCLQMQKKYPLAISSWYLTSLFDPKNPFPYFHSAECFFLLNEKEKALLSLMDAEERCSEETDAALLEKIDFLKKQWDL